MLACSSVACRTVDLLNGGGSEIQCTVILVLSAHHLHEGLHTSQSVHRSCEDAAASSISRDCLKTLRNACKVEQSSHSSRHMM